MEKGVVRTLIVDRGYGFVRASGRDYFFHVSQCGSDFFNMTPGDLVTFETESTNKGTRAINVTKIHNDDDAQLPNYHCLRLPVLVSCFS